MMRQPKETPYCHGCNKLTEWKMQIMERKLYIICECRTRSIDIRKIERHQYDQVIEMCKRTERYQEWITRRDQHRIEHDKDLDRSSEWESWR